jgi:endonuclease/exonuclease/phosphatase family metal-dependent hydrolase
LGTQETLRFQTEHILQQLPQYHYVGQSRDADKPDEECGVFFRGDRFHHLEQGHFWLSETPDHPGSKSWDAALPRMATWVKLFDRTARQAVYFVNTHFDHQGVVAREHSGRLIHDWLQKLGRDSAVILSGDFNTTEASAPYVTLTAPSESLSLVDSFRAVHPHAQENTGTYNGFHGIRDGARIDWVLFSSRFRAIEAGIDTTSRANRFPSDHFPVYAVLAWSSEVTQDRASSQAE